MKKTIILITIFAVLAAASVPAFGRKEDKSSGTAGADSEAAGSEGSSAGSAEAVSGNNQDSATGFQQDPGPWKQLKDAPSEEIQITGLVERGFENRISIVVKPESKSRLSYYPDEKGSKKLEKMLVQTVTVSGKVRAAGSPFNKEIIISEIIK